MFLSKTFTKEPDIVKRCLRGDRKAQRKLYEAYAGKFLSLCLRYGKNRMVAEDVMIEGFMKIFEKLPQFKGTGSLECKSRFERIYPCTEKRATRGRN